MKIPGRPEARCIRPPPSQLGLPESIFVQWQSLARSSACIGARGNCVKANLQFCALHVPLGAEVFIIGSRLATDGLYFSALARCARTLRRISNQVSPPAAFSNFFKFQNA